MAKPNFIAEIFNDRFNLHHPSIMNIVFNPAWSNGTGYYDGAVSGEFAPLLSPGEMVRCISNNNRKMIIVGTHLGNIVVFQRYTDCDDVFVLNATSELNRTGMYEKSSGINERDMLTIIGRVHAYVKEDETRYCVSDYNIGEKIERMLKVANSRVNTKASESVSMAF